MHLQERLLSIGQCATLAIILEATAPKPGNVHRGADFDDLCYPDFLLAAVAMGPIMDRAQSEPLGKTILDAATAVAAIVGTNTSLGTVLLIAPLATVPREVPLDSGVADVLNRLKPADARDVYEAIRLARPGGMGTVAAADLAGPAPECLLQAMRLAADRDMVARQYTEHFHHVLHVVVPSLRQAVGAGCTLLDSIVHIHLKLMSDYPDSLIARKCGLAVAQEAAARAGHALDAHSAGEQAYHQALADLDFWLRSDGNRRNPGTTADLIAAGLFVALRDDIIKFPLRIS